MEKRERSTTSAACPLYDPKNVTAYLPPGLIINPQAVPHCKLAEYFAEECQRLKVAVGTLDLRVDDVSSSAYKFIEPVLNLESSNRYPGELGSLVDGAPFILITSSIRDGYDYEVNSTTTSVQAGLNRSRLNLWGVPAESAHDPLRGKICEGFGNGAPGSYYDLLYDYLDLAELEEWCSLENTDGGDSSDVGGKAETPETPFVTMPTECSGEALTVVGRYDSWQQPNIWAERSAQLQPVEACNALSFEPTIEARPTTTLADAPSGLEFDLHVPQNEDPHGVATPELKEAVVKLPGRRPPQSRLRQRPPRLLRSPGQPPRRSALRLSRCLQARRSRSHHCRCCTNRSRARSSSPRPTTTPSAPCSPATSPSKARASGSRSPARIETDPQTGQITTSFPENPQLPFEDLKLRIFGGALGALRTPATCGVYEDDLDADPLLRPGIRPPGRTNCKL